MSEETSLITKYRPKSFEEVIGQDDVVKSLKSAVKKGLSHATLFTGGSGVGKTTLARILLIANGCTGGGDVYEYDAASFTGIDDIRALKVTLQTRPLGGRPKGIIIDEFHTLSKQSFDALLKVIEEAREWLYWVFCTTEPEKVRQTIRTRCTCYHLKAVHKDELHDLLVDIADKEEFKCSDEVIGVCAREARGSPRQAISFLAVCADIKNRAEAAALIQSADESTEAINLARLLVKRADWSQCLECLGTLSELNGESIRHVVRAYVTTTILGTRKTKDAAYLYKILDAFSTPFFSGDGLSPVVHAVGKVIFGEIPFDV